MSVQNSNDALQNALSHVEEQFKEGQAIINKMKKDEGDIAKYQKELARLKELLNLPFVEKGPIERLIAKEEAKEKGIKKDLKQQEAVLEKLDPELKALCNTINSLIACIEGAINDGRTDVSLVMKDLANTSKILTQIFKAMGEELHADLLANAMDNQKLTPKELQKLATESAGYAAREGEDLSSAENNLASLIEAYHKAYDAAKADLARYNFWDDAFGDGEAKKARDRDIMHNASAMIKGLTAVMSSLSPAIANYTPELTEAMNVLKEVLSKIEKIVNDIKLSPKEKQKEVLALVMFVLSFFEVIKQDVESLKQKNKQEMSKGNVQASKDNIEDTKMYEKIQKEAEHNAKVMKVTMIVAEVVLGGLMMLAAPGVGTALLVAMMTAMQVAGSCDSKLDATAALAKTFHSKIAADIFVGAMECLATCGGGAMLDSVMNSAIEASANSATEATEKALQEAIKTAAEEAAAAAGKAGDEAAVSLAKDSLETVAKSAAEKAAVGAGKQFMRQSFAILSKLAAQGTLKESMELAMEKAAKDAATSAIEEAATVAKLAARGVVSTDQILDEIATKSANEAIAKTAGISSEKAAKEGLKTSGEIAMSRGLWTAVFATGNTNLLTDIYKKAGGHNDTILETLEVIQGIIQMMALMMGSGMLDNVSFEELSSNGALTKTATSLQMIPQATESAASYGNYQTYKDEAGAVKGLSMTQSVADLLHAFIEQQQKDGGAGLSSFIRAMQQDMSTNQALAAHINDGDLAGIQILVSSAG